MTNKSPCDTCDLMFNSETGERKCSWMPGDVCMKIPSCVSDPEHHADCEICSERNMCAIARERLERV